MMMIVTPALLLDVTPSQPPVDELIPGGGRTSVPAQSQHQRRTCTGFETVIITNVTMLDGCVFIRRKLFRDQKNWENLTFLESSKLFSYRLAKPSKPMIFPKV